MAMDSNDKMLWQGDGVEQQKLAAAAEPKQAQAPITPLHKPPTNDQRDISTMLTMDVFKQVKEGSLRAHDAADAGREFDDELWKHLEGRLLYLLNMAGLR